MFQRCGSLAILLILLQIFTWTPHLLAEPLFSHKEDVLECDLKVVSNGLLLQIKTEKDITTNAFVLSDPARLIIDLNGAVITKSVKFYDLKGLLKSVRIGRHPDKTRFVLDFAGETSLPYRLEQVGSSINVFIEDSSVIKDPPTQTPTKVETPLPTTTLIPSKTPSPLPSKVVTPTPTVTKEVTTLKPTPTKEVKLERTFSPTPSTTPRSAETLTPRDSVAPQVTKFVRATPTLKIAVEEEFIFTPTPTPFVNKKDLIIPISGITVDKTELTFKSSDRPIQDLTINNTSDEDIFISAKILKSSISESSTAEDLYETSEVVVSPRLPKVMAQSSRVIRVLLRTIPSNSEELYRIELYVKKSVSRLAPQARLLDIDVFAEPRNVNTDFTWERHPEKIVFINSGNVHALLSDLRICRAAGKTHCQVMPDLRIYAGATKALPLPTDSTLQLIKKSAGEYKNITIKPEGALLKD
jgi:hypothetical protein